MAEPEGNDRFVRNVVVFDLDHTLSKHDTYLQFLFLFLKNHPSRLFRCFVLPWAVVLHKLHFHDNSWLKEKFLTAIAAGKERKHVEEVAKAFVKKLRYSGLYVSAKERIRQHRRQNDYLIMASASFDFYVNLLASELHFDQVVCTRAEWDPIGRLTGRIAGHNCYGEHKKEATKRVLSSLYKRRKITVYSDHHSDIPLFSIADHPVAINPTGKLKQFAVEKRIMIERWQ